jgi:regulator of sirC expression with transglutaminase-like and TPR domain
VTLSRQERLQEFGSLVHGPDREIPVCRAALLFSADADPTMDIARQMDDIRALGDTILARLDRPATQSPLRTLRTFLAVFHREFQFRGDDETFDAPENSQLHRVLARRRGLPILLSVLAVEFLRQLGLEAYGVALPGRYIARCETENGPAWFDPFNPGAGAGTLLTEWDCVQLALSHGIPVSPGDLHQTLSPARNHSTLVRMLNNLAGSYERRAMHQAFAQTLDWCLMLQPGDPELTLTRGLAYNAAGLPGLAMRDLERYMHLGAPGPRAGRAAEILRQLRSGNPMN